jgi:hypothetical protein
VALVYIAQMQRVFPIFLFVDTQRITESTGKALRCCWPPLRKKLDANRKHQTKNEDQRSIT